MKAENDISQLIVDFEDGDISADKFLEGLRTAVNDIGEEEYELQAEIDNAKDAVVSKESEIESLGFEIEELEKENHTFRLGHLNMSTLQDQDKYEILQRMMAGLRLEELQRIGRQANERYPNYKMYLGCQVA